VVNFIQSIVTWVSGNWAQIIEAWLMVIGAASIIVKLTPTLKDDDALKWLIKFTGKYVALNRTSSDT
jgi:hypothetical protein